MPTAQHMFGRCYTTVIMFLLTGTICCNRTQTLIPPNALIIRAYSCYLLYVIFYICANADMRNKILQDFREKSESGHA